MIYTDKDGEAAFEAIAEFQEMRGYGGGVVLFKKRNNGATLPTYGSNSAAGMDLYANFYDMTGSFYNLVPGERKLFKTGLAVAVPESTYGRIAPRSGLAYKHGIDIMGGVIDEDYRGDIGVILINHGDEPFIVTHGDRIAQMIITSYVACAPLEIDDFYDETERGEGGFGSTG